MIKDVLMFADKSPMVEGQGQAGMLKTKASGQELGRNGWEGVCGFWRLPQPRGRRHAPSAPPQMPFYCSDFQSSTHLDSRNASQVPTISSFDKVCSGLRSQSWTWLVFTPISRW